MSEQALILASQSPRRAELLREAGIAVDVVPPKYGEPDPERWTHTPIELAEAISYFKAAGVGQDYPERVILGADTTVAAGDRIFGKAENVEHARRILSALMGTTHQVITGVTLLVAGDMRRLISHDVTQVTMRRLSPVELDTYLAGGQWEGKAGAYGIQDQDDPFVQRIDGSFSNVVGLPIELTLRMLRQFGIDPQSYQILQ
jgi:septum formation protein